MNLRKALLGVPNGAEDEGKENRVKIRIREGEALGRSLHVPDTASGAQLALLLRSLGSERGANREIR
jgi:hypothetical protein